MTTRKADRSGDVRVIELTIADEPDAWAAAGFTVDPTGSVVVDGYVLRLIGTGDTGPGVRGWTLAGLPSGGTDRDGEAGTLDGLPTTFLARPPADPSAPDGFESSTIGGFGVGPRLAGTEAPHPNGVVGIDHLVVLSGDLERTISAFEADQIACRRIREAGEGDRAVRQGFFRFGRLIVEVASGPVRTGRTAAEEPATFYGLSFDVEDLDRTAAALGEALGPIRAAVQTGRRIATLRGRGLGGVEPGVTTAIAFMDDHGDRTEPAPG